MHDMLIRAYNAMLWNFIALGYVHQSVMIPKRINDYSEGIYVSIDMNRGCTYTVTVIESRQEDFKLIDVIECDSLTELVHKSNYVRGLF